MDVDPLPSYTLSTQSISDGEPLRCLALLPSTSILAGSQSGLISSFTFNNNNEASIDIQPGQSPRHPHQITALLSHNDVYITGCKDGIIRVFDSNTHALRYQCIGHTNAVTSLSVMKHNDVLLSGSWDGTAKLWRNDVCIDTLEGHENTVSVAGMDDGIVTVSAGVAQGNVIKNHSIRLWSFDESSQKATMVNCITEDHDGPIRDVCYDPVSQSIYTCSNDGTVKIRSRDGGAAHTTLAYPKSDPPMLLSVCIVRNRDTMYVAAAGEDGNLILWNLDSNQTQIVAHPGCVWDVLPLLNGDIGTACHDGQLRIFTTDPGRIASEEVLSSFEEQVKASQSTKKSGPTPEEIAKLPKWEMNALTQGRSEGQVQLFNKNSVAIAAQWSDSSKTWIEVGEVTGSNPNAGSINGVSYDHVLPIEIDRPDGGVSSLKIGYNNGENPFVVAQNFIDEYTLDQGYLSQIADYIRQRVGEGGMVLGDGGAPSGGGASSIPTTIMESTPTYEHLPVRGYKFFDAGIDKKGLTKILQKMNEFNATVSNPLSTSDREALDSLTETLSITNRYHSTSISDVEMIPLRTMIVQWNAANVFPALDLARITVLHPDAAKADRCGYWKEVLNAALSTCLGLGDGAAKEVAVPMLTMRLVCNCFRGGTGAADAAGSLLERILDCIALCVSSGNKNVRLAVATALLNMASYMHSSSSSSSVSSAIRILDLVGTIAGSSKYEAEAISRVLVALGTMLLIPGARGDEAKRTARERGMVSMAERVASGHDLSVAVAKEIRSILS